VNDQGAAAGVFHVPMTYPPTTVDGFMIAGGLAAGWTDPEMPNFSSDPEIGRMVLDLSGGRYPLDTVVSYEKHWRSPATVTRIERIQRLRREVLGRLLERTDPDFLFTVFEGPDRLQHVHYQYIVEGSDWYRRPEATEIRDRAYSYFGEVDRAIVELTDWAGADGHVVIVSDHGAGPWEKTVNMNLLLGQWGYVKLPPLSRITRLGVIAGSGQRLARRVVPRSLLHAAKARISRGIRWDASTAFASHVAEQGIHVNERGSFPEGVVDPEDVERLQKEISERLFELVDPADGQPVVDRVVLRDEVIHGPHASRSPHLFPFLRDQRYELSDTIAAASAFTDHRNRPWGYHHSDGIFVAAGPNAASGRFEQGLEMVDVLPTVLHLAGFGVPEGLDGRVVEGVLSSSAVHRPVATTAPIVVDDGQSTEYPFSPEEEAEIEESLRGLGYIE
jgi:predicted AlkP superfamily phosphohydrolase/phosphomutase